jgi:Leucine-rich repeat (LRR) protein
MTDDSSLNSVLTKEVILEFSGSEELKDVKLLVLRSVGLKDVRSLSIVPGLVSLSLSHNKLQVVDLPAGSLPVLEELNINQNELTNLACLSMCPALARLYASSNQIADLTPLSKFCPRLKTAGLHGNRIQSLDHALASLKHLELEDAELDGNPCSETASYRWAVIDALPMLRRLDSETITDGDRSRASDMKSTSVSSASIAASTNAEQKGTFWTNSDIPDPPHRMRRPATSHQNT